MAERFPSLGQTLNKMQGMFIGDTHDNPAHVVALKLKLHELASAGVKVLFLEYYFQDQQNISVFSPTLAHTHLSGRNFLHHDDLPQNLSNLAEQANRFDIALYGIDAHTPKSNVGGSKLLLSRVNTRTGQELNRLWTNHVKKVMATFPEPLRRFAIFGGARHGQALKGAGLPNIPLYYWDTSRVEYREYAQCGLAGRIDWVL